MFSKKPAGQPHIQAKPATRSPMANATFSVLGADMAIKGDVSASSELHIDGRIEGDVECASLVQGENSEVIGAVKAGSAKLSGTVRGTITAGELVISKSARIHGDVFYDTLTIEPGAQVDGRLSTRSAPAVEPAKDGDDASEPLLTLASSAS